MIELEYLDNEIPVYDITVDETECFFADDLLIHNCVEVLEYTKPLTNVEDLDGEIALCTLAALNVGVIKSPKDLEGPARILVRALDNLLSYQDYLLPAAENCALGRRSIGIGFTNLAYWLAKNDLTYSSPDVNKISELAEHYAYYVIKASVDLAKEIGPCSKFDESIYSEGLVPLDFAGKGIKDLTKGYKEQCDWKTLRADAKKYGIRNYPLLAGMPCETSALISNSTNAFEPIRSIITVKGSKDRQIKQVAPESRRLKNKYETKWSIKSPVGYLTIAAIFQKYMDQSLSTNTFYNPAHTASGKLDANMLIRDIMYFYKLGGKTLYYSEINDQAGEIEIEDAECESCAV